MDLIYNWLPITSQLLEIFGTNIWHNVVTLSSRWTEEVLLTEEHSLNKRFSEI